MEKDLDGEIQHLFHFRDEDIAPEDHYGYCHMPWCNVWKDVKEYLYRTARL